MTQINKLHSYAKVWNLSHRETKELLSDTCIVEEKIDGSQFSFGVKDGELCFRSKGATILEDSPQDIFKSAVKSVRRIHDKIGIREGWVYRGEALKGLGHNTLKYEREPAGNVIIWDIDQGVQDLLSWDDKQQESERLGLETVPVLYEGKVTLNILNEVIKLPPILGGTIMEGVVIKRLYNNTIFGTDGKVLVGKYVTDDFREKHKNNPAYKKANRKDIVALITSQYATEARWRKSVQHLAESGELEYVPQDIPKIIKAIHADIEEECMDDIKDDLVKHYWKQLSKGFISGFPEWWKRLCIERNIDE